MRTLPLALALLALAACADPGEAPPPASPDTLAPAVEAPDTTVAAETGETPGLALDDEGLRLVVPSSGSTRLVAFGTPFADAVAAVERALGDAGDTGRNEECGVGPLDYAGWDGLTVYGNDGAFSGWYADDRTEAPQTTIDGVGPGTTRAQLEAARTIEVTEGSIGPEFNAGDTLFGFLDDVGPDAPVTALYAGDSCIFR